MHQDLITLIELCVIIITMIIGYFIHTQLIYKKTPEERVYNELVTAIKRGQTDRVYDMCQHVPLDILRMEDEMEETILFSIIKHGYTQALNILLNRLSYDDLVKKNILHQTPIMLSAFSYKNDMCKNLITYLHVTDLNVQDDEGNTALHYAFDTYRLAPLEKRQKAHETLLFIIQSMNKAGLLIKNNK